MLHVFKTYLSWWTSIIIYLLKNLFLSIYVFICISFVLLKQLKLIYSQNQKNLLKIKIYLIRCDRTTFSEAFTSFNPVTAGAQYPCGPRGLLLVDRGLFAVLSFLKNFRAFFCSFFCVIIFETLSFFVRIFSILCDYMCESFCILRRILLYSYCIILLCISCGKSRIILSDLNSLLFRVILGDTLHGVKRGGGCIQVERPLLKLPSESVTLDCVSEFGRVVVLKGLLACLLNCR